MIAGDQAQGSAPPPAAALDQESAEWLRDLRGNDPARRVAQERLHRLLLGVARGELARRRHTVPITGPELDDLAHQAAADALVAILARLGQFRGESRFMTWAYRFAILEVTAKLGRHFWRRPGVALDDEDWDRLPDRFSLDPARASESRSVLEALCSAVDEQLTPLQRRVFVAVVLNEIPLDAIVAELGCDRNAIYKTLFEARRKLRTRLTKQGYLGFTGS